MNPVDKLLQSPAVRKASPAVRAWLIALLRRGERTSSAMQRLKKSPGCPQCPPPGWEIEFNEETRQALQDATEGKNLTRYQSVEEMFEDLGIREKDN